MTRELAEFILARPFGFVTEAEMPAIIQQDRLVPLLVRCGCTRFWLSDSVMFNEGDCGGAFDGFRVTSDADPGL